MNRNLTAAALAGLLVIAASGCASTPQQTHFSLVPTKSNGQSLPGLDALTTLESRQPGGIVSVRVERDYVSSGAGLIVAVQNKSASPVEFGPQNIEAMAGGQKLPILAAAELDARAKAQVAGYVRATNRTGTTDIDKATASAERDYRYNTFGGNAAGQGGMSSCVLASDDNCRAYRVDRQNRETDAKVLAEAAAVMEQNEQLLKKALRPATVAPEKMAGGMVVVEPPKGGGPVDITVTFNGQKHRFTFNATPAA